ncbi:BQ5605_C034g11341 [Microbotryum silenes-dioicae]|uniref:BQ5605_C034g11341 protein n=1 Tax=Microbotryum silenes-dioicae TaxID=796604 RepID=A0A2X0MGQ5_9BASI|nr:BQ5605_C034g11341 [Microbotryum silenes-dioicae]
MTLPTRGVTLPLELLQAILSCLPTQLHLSIKTLLACSASSRSLRQIALDSYLWRPHVAARWRRGKQCTYDDDALQFYRLRSMRDTQVEHDIRTLASTSHGRIPLIEALRGQGDEVIEALEQLQRLEDFDRPLTWLSERYWAQQAYRCILRDQAIAVWATIADETVEQEDSFEKGVWAFVAFRDGVDYRDYLLSYDMVRHPKLLALLASQRVQGEALLEHVAVSVMSYMRRIGFRAADATSFHDLDNHFLSHVWSGIDPEADPSARFESGTLPMSLVSIFCSFVRRLPKEYNIRAKPIGFPGVMLAGVALGDSADWVMVNVFEGKIAQPSDLQRMLLGMRLEMVMPISRLGPAPAKTMCGRVAQNILTSVRRGDDDVVQDHYALVSAHYSVALALYHFAAPESRHLYANWAVSVIQAEYPHDVSYLENTLSRVFTGERAETVLRLCREMRDDDMVGPEPQLGTSRIRWRIGQVFRHRLFGYCGVVRGFDEECLASEEWIQSMGVDTLPHGRSQPFYHVIIEGGGTRYVAQENIGDEEHRSIPFECIENLAGLSMMGRYFCSMDMDMRGRWRFVKSCETAAMYPETSPTA